MEGIRRRSVRKEGENRRVRKQIEARRVETMARLRRDCVKEDDNDEDEQSEEQWSVNFSIVGGREKVEGVGK